MQQVITKTHYCRVDECNLRKYFIRYYSNRNSKSHDNVYGAVIISVHCHCEGSPGSSDECSMQSQVTADLWTKPISLSQ